MEHNNSNITTWPGASVTLPSATAENIGKLAKKLAQIMEAVDHVEKRGRNQFHNYNYVKASDIAHAFRGELAAHGIAHIYDVESVEYRDVAAKEGTMLCACIMVRHRFIDSETGAEITFRSSGIGMDKGDKGLYKAFTGAVKYMLRNTFLVPDENDPEADDSVDSAMARRNKSPEQAQRDVQMLRNDPDDAPANDPPRNRTAPKQTQRAQKVAEEVPGVQVGVKTGQWEGHVTDVKFLVSSNNRKYAKVTTDEPENAPQHTLYCWDEKLHQYLSGAKGKQCGFGVTSDAKGEKWKLDKIFWVGGQEFDGKLPVVEGGV